jgi:hypothetical protein
MGLTMKLARLTLALLTAVALAAAAPAQTYYHGRQRNAVVPPNAQSLAALQQDLINAIEAMKTALPIYDGNRVRSIHAAHAALVIVDREINGPKGATRALPVVNDGVKSASAKSQYNGEQISASQTNMQKGLAALQQAMKDLVGATGSNPNQKGIRVSNHLKIATAEATKAISLHSSP